MRMCTWLALLYTKCQVESTAQVVHLYPAFRGVVVPMPWRRVFSPDRGDIDDRATATPCLPPHPMRDYVGLVTAALIFLNRP
jgi:hypothetical protein